MGITDYLGKYHTPLPDMKYPHMEKDCIHIWAVSDIYTSLTSLYLRSPSPDHAAGPSGSVVPWSQQWFWSLQEFSGYWSLQKVPVFRDDKSWTSTFWLVGSNEKKTFITLCFFIVLPEQFSELCFQNPLLRLGRSFEESRLSWWQEVPILMEWQKKHHAVFYKVILLTANSSDPQELTIEEALWAVSWVGRCIVRKT